jgi:hypothetical protein
MRTLPRSHTLAAALVALLALPACTCDKKEETSTDHDRLKEKLDVLKVHLYVGTKATLAEGGEGAAKLAATREALLKLLRAGDDGDDAAEKLSLGDAVKLGREVLTLRKRGKAIVRAGGDHPPILPGVLKALEQEQELKIDANTEHALLLGVLLLAKVHPKVKVPVPEELLLYEASRTDAAALKSFGALAHAAKAYVYARNELCDLSATEAATFSAAGKGIASELDALARLLPRSKALKPEQRAQAAAAFTALVHAASATCYLRRGEERKARVPMEEMLNAAEKSGVRNHTTELLRAYLECAEGESRAPQGLARLKKLLADKAAPGAIREDATTLKTYCETAPGTSSKLLKKIAFASLLLKLSAAQLERSKLTEGVEDSKLFKAVRKLARVTDFLGKLGSKKPSAGAVKDRARGLLDRLKQGAKRSGEGGEQDDDD